MNCFFNFKTIVFTMVLAVFSTLQLSAQRSDDFFRVEEEFNDNRAIVNWGIINNGIGQSEVPVGSGILILTAAGAGYAIMRRKRKSNKGTILLLAFALLISMTGCKKNILDSSVSGSGVYITLNVDNGSKVNVNPTGGPTYATVDWEIDDVIYVGNNGVYCGYLTYNGTEFVGIINPTSGDDADYLHFYFMGNRGTTSEPTSVSITDQTGKYPVISYGRSTTLYNAGTTSYSTKLLNKCAIMKFTTTNISKVITITGMNNTVTVDFSANNGATTGEPYSFSKSGNGRIRLHSQSNTERWAILLPQEEVTTATAYAEGYTTNAAFTVETVSANGYYNSGKNIELSPGSNVPGAFTINSYGDQVFISSGNLQARTSDYGASWTWQFAAWDYFGSSSYNQYYHNARINGDGIVKYSDPGTVDLFGWVGESNTTWDGATGTTSNAAMHGITNSKTLNSTATYGNVSGECLKSDWGNTINDGYKWYTPTISEWIYLLTTRSSGSTVNGTSNARYVLAQISTTTNSKVNGLIIFPNGVTIDNSEATSWSYINGGVESNYASYPWTNATQCTTGQWTALAAKGCVFLPAAGVRNNGANETYPPVNYPNDACYYWSATPNGVNYALFMHVDRHYGVLDTGTIHERWYGHPVRLVRDAN